MSNLYSFSLNYLGLPNDVSRGFHTTLTHIITPCMNETLTPAVRGQVRELLRLRQPVASRSSLPPSPSPEPQALLPSPPPCDTPASSLCDAQLSVLDGLRLRVSQF